MKSNLLKTAPLLLLLLSATIMGVARGGRHRRKGRPGRREVKAYFQANILPVLQQQRQKLEPQLSAADRTQLATYRTQLKALKEQGQALRHSVRPSGKAPPPAPPSPRPSASRPTQLRFQAHGHYAECGPDGPEIRRPHHPAHRRK